MTAARDYPNRGVAQKLSGAPQPRMDGSNDPMDGMSARSKPCTSLSFSLRGGAESPRSCAVHRNLPAVKLDEGGAIA